MIVIDLKVEQGSGSTLIVDDEQNLTTSDNFGNIFDRIVTFEDTSGPINLVGDVDFSTIDEFGSTMIMVVI